MVACGCYAVLCCAISALVSVTGCAGTTDTKGGAGASNTAGGAGAGGDSGQSCIALTRCGGDPIGTWQAGPGTGAGAATNTCAIPNLPPVKDCSDLVYLPANAPTPGINSASLPLPTQTELTRASLTLSADHSYLFSAHTIGEAALHASAACLTAHGANPTCAELQAQLLTFYAVEPELSNLVCSSAPSGGCDCSYTFQLEIADPGTWQTNGDALSLTSSNAQTTATYDFCEVADDLSLSVSSGSPFLGGSALGTRTLALQRAQ